MDGRRIEKAMKEAKIYERAFVSKFFILATNHTYGKAEGENKLRKDK